jgi:hypothetical protein
VRSVLPTGQILRLRPHRAVSPRAADPAPSGPDWGCAAVGFAVVSGGLSPSAARRWRLEAGR